MVAIPCRQVITVDRIGDEHIASGNDDSDHDSVVLQLMKIVVDDKIPYIKGALEPFAEVVYLPGNQTSAKVVKDADALITRTRTICNSQLLEGSKVKLIATATIGFDHIDTTYCKQSGIAWVNAPGCNAESVNQYISSALVTYATRKGVSLKDKTIGIVGVGQVGSRVAKTCKILGMKVMLNDPPRTRQEGSEQFVPLVEICEQADIISFHVPLNMDGVDCTYHMVNRDFLGSLVKKPLIINTCRGEVFDTSAVYQASSDDKISGVIIDCWENEPEPDLDLLRLVDFGTAHIAGYSKDGKANGTMMSVRAISRFFSLGINEWAPAGVEPPENPVIDLDGAGLSEQGVLTKAIRSTYKIEQDDECLRQNPHLFEQLRGDYPVRREFDSYTINALNVPNETVAKLGRLNFKLLVT